MDNKYFFRNKLLLKLIKTIDNLGRIFFKPRGVLSFKPQKILISNIGHLGDILLSLKVVEVIKSKDPDVSIYFLCSTWSYDLIRKHPFINDIIVYDSFFLSSSTNFFLKFLRSSYLFIKAFLKIRKISVDTAFDLRASFPNTIILLRVGGAKRVYGYGTVGFGFLCDKTAEWEEGKHEIEHYMDVIRCVYKVEDYEIKKQIDLSYLTKDVDEKKLFERLGIDITERFVVFHICSRDKRKMIDVEKWLKLFDYISSKYKVIFTGSKNEFEYINRYFSNKPNALNLAGKINVGELILLLKKAYFVISVDSFVGQIAGMLNLNSIIVFSGGVDVKRFGPLGKNSYVLKKDIPCSPCYWYRREDCKYECMDLDILEKFREVEQKIK